MFSRFLKKILAANNTNDTSKNTKNYSCRSCYSWLIFVPVLLCAGCSSENRQISAAPTIEKHYIEPPKQQKIPASKTALRVCADPNNLPFSNEKREGFENKIAEVFGREMNLPVEYTWWAQRRGFFRNTLRAGVCDVVIGVPESFELAATTAPYYRSTYVFVSRADRNLEIKSFDDEALKSLKIGVIMVGDDGTNTPPAHALANRGITKNVIGFMIYGDYREPNPPARIVDAVAKGDVDVAIVWGPLAGYFAKKENVKLKIEPVAPQIDLPYLPFVYDISVGIRRGEDELKNQIEQILTRRRNEIEKILDDYNIPRVPAETVKKEEQKNFLPRINADFADKNLTDKNLIDLKNPRNPRLSAANFLSFFNLSYGREEI
ncbi:MAG TPA: substrate-binding domain-containing protein [Pyrinomonadaceae bacterium]|jgi:quinoprotein dehydrogenase-associated probable ABC transporter substrate-binding protein